MSNQIVQLTDKDTNNIFPVAGSMAGNSIETGMIKDGAVTTAKITDGSITTAKIADSAVTSGKIDWGSLGITYQPGDSVQSVYPTWGFITVDDDPTMARLFIPLAKVPKASTVTFSGGAGNASYGFVVDSNGTNHFLQLAAYQTATGVATYQGIYLQVSLGSSAGATYATGILTLNEGSLSFS